VSNYRGGEPDYGTIEGSNEDLGVGVEGVGDVKVVGGEVLEVRAEGVFGSACVFAGYGDVGAAIVKEDELAY
jgi:hypothetical protein